MGNSAYLARQDGLPFLVEHQTMFHLGISKPDNPALLPELLWKYISKITVIKGPPHSLESTSPSKYGIQAYIQLENDRKN